MSSHSSTQKQSLQKFINEYTEMKQKLSQMNEMLQLEKKSSDLYLEKSQQLEIANRTLEEENNTLKANYTHIQKRYDKLQHELSEAKKNTKSSSYSMFSYFTGSSSNDEKEQLRQKIKALENELEIKIKENEECHVQVFEYKKTYNDKCTEFENTETSLRKQLNNKAQQIQTLTDQNESLSNLKAISDCNLQQAQNTINELSAQIENNKKVYDTQTQLLNREIKQQQFLINNSLCVNEYSSQTNIRTYNIFEFVFKNKNAVVKKQKEVIINIVQQLRNIICLKLPNIIDAFINQCKIYKTLLISTTNDKYLYAFNKVESHLRTIILYIKSIELFFTIVTFSFENENLSSNEINKLSLYKNIIFTLIVHISSLNQIIYKYISTIKLDNFLFINDFYILIQFIDVHIFQKAFLIFNYDSNYNSQYIHVSVNDNNELKINIDKEYIHNKSSEMNYRIVNGDFIKKLLFNDCVVVNKYINAFTQSIIASIEQSSQLINTDKDIESSNTNTILLLKDFSLVISNYINSDINKQIVNAFIYGDTYINAIDFFIMKKYENIYHLYNKQIFPNNNEISYIDSINNLNKVKEYEHQTELNKNEKTKMQSKITELEEQLTQIKHLYENEQNENDLLKMKLQSNTTTLASTQLPQTIKQSQIPTNEFEEFIKNQQILTDKQQSLLSKELLLNDKEPFSITNISHLQKQANVEYHRKVLEILKRYLHKVENVDTKIAVNTKQKELKKEYDKKLKDIEKKYKNKEKELTDSIEGYVQQVTFLASSMNEYEALKDKLCATCKKHIPTD